LCRARGDFRWEGTPFSIGKERFSYTGGRVDSLPAREERQQHLPFHGRRKKGFGLIGGGVFSIEGGHRRVLIGGATLGKHLDESSSSPPRDSASTKRRGKVPSMSRPRKIVSQLYSHEMGSGRHFGVPTKGEGKGLIHLLTWRGGPQGKREKRRGRIGGAPSYLRRGRLREGGAPQRRREENLCFFG